MSNLLFGGLTILVLVILLYFFPIVQICGYSMYPTMMDGEFYLGMRVFRKDKCKPGRIYVYRPPYKSEEEKFVIKRLSAVKFKNKKVKYWFLGDNACNSYDSRYYGDVDSERVVAQIILMKRGVK